MLIRSLKYRVLAIIILVPILYSILTKLSRHGKFDISMFKIFRTIPPEKSISTKLAMETCIFPKVSSNYEDIDFLFKPQQPLNCKNDEMDWVTCEKTKCFVRNAILKNEQNVKCYFIDIMFSTDFGTYEGAMTVGVTYTFGRSDVVKVYCKAAKKSWSSILIGIRNQTVKTAHNPFAPVGISMNVLIIGFSSISRSTFVKTLPQTYHYLTKILKGSVLRGYNVIDKGTLSSLYPILTGKTKEELTLLNKQSWQSHYIDDYPFIWKAFREGGYVTAYLEDFSLWGSVESKLQGFEFMPTDHYIRPYFVSIKDKIRTWKNFCSGPIPRYKIFTDYIKNFFSMYRSRRKFLFSFQGELTHNDYNALAKMDDHLLNFFRNLQTANFLENTVLIVMSDQGYNFSSIKNTLETFLEEKFPFFYIRLPPSFSKTHKELYKNFKNNIHRLTTPFDIHSTLKSILYHLNEENNNRSISLFNEFPDERSCFDAQIRVGSCACMVARSVATSSPIVRQLKKALEDTMNNMTLFLRDRCAKLTVLSVTDVVRLIPNQILSRYKVNTDYYSMMAIVLPGYTVYEATFARDLTNYKVTVEPNDIVSHDFGLQSRCIKRSYPKLRKYCYCMDQTVYDT